MIAVKLVRLIESHAEQLARGLIEKLHADIRATGMRKVPAHELQLRAYDVYHNFSDWLLNKTESDIERQYVAIGARRASQGVPLSDLVYAILAVKEHLWEFLRREGLVDRALELYQELQLFQLVDVFFDRAIYFAVAGYERARAARAA